MPAAPSMCSAAYIYLSGQLDIFLTQRYGDVVEAVRGPLLTGLVIYIAFYAFAIMRGVVQEPLTDFVYRGVKLAVIFTAATTVAYQTWITDPLFHGAPSAVTRAISGKEYENMGQVFDGLEGQSMQIYVRLQTAADAMEIWQAPRAICYYLISFVVRLFGGLAAIIGFGVSMLALIALAIIIAMGPIFIALSLFDWGKRYFNGWLNQAFNYIVLLAIITTMGSLITDMGEQIFKTQIEDDISAAMLYIFFCILGSFFFFQAPGIAAGITGGAAAGASDLVGSAARVASRASGMGWLNKAGGGKSPGGGGGIKKTP